MKSIITFTSNLSPNLMSWITTYSKRKSSTKREVIEQAIIMYKEYVTKKEMEQSFKKASKDKEIIEMAEDGIGDYEEQLKKNKINNLKSDSEIITFQARTISKDRLIKKIGEITDEELSQVLEGLFKILKY